LAWLAELAGLNADHRADDDTVLSFDSTGKLLTETGRNGRATTYT
jgi:hypothetical protein